MSNLWKLYISWKWRVGWYLSSVFLWVRIWRYKQVRRHRTKKANYKRVGACKDDLVVFVRKPYGIELPGFNESDNIEATSDAKYIEYKKYLENAEINYEKAEERLLDYCGSSVHTPIFLDDEAFNIFNALAFSEGIIGFKSAYSLAICYASGCGCKKNLDIAHYLLDDILKRYEIK